MLIKKLIQRLLDSRTTPSEAGHNAMPSSAPTTISSPTSITSWGTITTFTAPDDGYVTFRGRSMVGSAAQIASLPLENNPTIITATQDNYQGMSCNLPVVKGKTVEVYGSNIENIVVSFNRLIGGYKILLWRALSCLRALSNYLPRCFCKANPNGLRPKACQKGGYSCHMSLLNMSLLTMDTLAFTKTLQTQGNLLMYMPLTQLIQSLQGFAWALLKDLLHTQKLFLLEKAARSLSLMRQIQSKNYGFRRLSAAINKLGVGGALC